MNTTAWDTYARRKPGGVLAFSQRPAVEGCYGCQASYITQADDPNPLVVKRWDYTPEMWADRLKRHGFRHPLANEIGPPGGWKTGTLLVRALTPGARARAAGA
ncbi:hypothetical protein [Streptomyces hiroshimensis]|uniref:Uncharacterized protein n=1 Tax=Streptomyces hiroshimensis TaxID=66424 RepID=A0ABQ2YJW3_9ACTN|nr:hypothetical protein [Streptomyces hiroshimensis]GGX84282.1 hypothetical protein GCM10010324_32340 [Streptomyces hiroshimensis]